MRSEQIRAASGLLVLLGVVTLCLSGCSREPRYHGKTLTKWIDVLYESDDEPAKQQEAKAAIRAIGTNALPYLTRWITSSDLTDMQRATAGFQLLGPASDFAIPTLAPLVESKDETTSVFAATSLAAMGPQAVPSLMKSLTNADYQVSLHVILVLPMLGTNARPAVPFLLAELNHPNHLYRHRSAVALGRLSMEPDLVVPALTKLVNDPVPAVRVHAVYALANFGSLARSAAPVLLARMQTDQSDSNAVRKALIQIAPETLD